MPLPVDQRIGRSVSARRGRKRYPSSCLMCQPLSNKLITPSFPRLQTSKSDVQFSDKPINRACSSEKVSVQRVTDLPARLDNRSFSSRFNFLNNKVFTNSLSRSSSYDSEKVLDGTPGDSEGTNLKRDASWSELLNRKEGEEAVLSAEEWMVDMSQLFLGRRFACGTYCRLYYGIYKDKSVAVKMLKHPDEDEEVARRLDRQFRSEVTVLSCLHHKNVVQFVAACRKSPVSCVITEYLSQGSLRTFLLKNKPHSLPLKMLISLALDVASGMEYLHSQGVIHRDLKSENLCLDEELCVKIVDFGVACSMQNCKSMSKDIGTYRWMAPEMISQQPYSKKVDVYSFGIVLWEICTGLIPFQEMTSAQAAYAVVEKEARPEQSSDCPPALNALMKECWSPIPDERPEFSQIVKKLEQLKRLVNQDVRCREWTCPLHDTNLYLTCFGGSCKKLPA
ncbi:hypothetical protein O6H91_13G027200 [Diphasiastrum complanatum]|uniref:Uncharacterized protein n=1 Tax=Diphasiastrum complanatum TaxID=34168 RepID=A0ACC2BU84_DIPCM|nr:hypothetical protein O6H91_Y171000 [Diphasiastrum complanatum]KAJ7532967.1 hypothetical protein O6H91_13G027200 [Diphasiastrum complanatum]